MCQTKVRRHLFNQKQKKKKKNNRKNDPKTQNTSKSSHQTNTFDFVHHKSLNIVYVPTNVNEEEKRRKKQILHKRNTHNYFTTVLTTLAETSRCNVDSTCSII